MIGAVIDLGNCLDLTSRHDIELVRAAHKSFIQARDLAGLPTPQNQGAKGRFADDAPLRYLDNAVLRHLHEIVENGEADGVAPFDTVRGVFPEGEVLYPGCGFKTHTHVQIAVRTTSCIKGYFIPVA